MLDAWDNPVRTRWSRRQTCRGVHLVWVAPGVLQELFIASAGSRAHAEIVSAGVPVDDALRMRCHTACSWRGRARSAQRLPAVALLAPRTATRARIARHPPRRSTVCRRSKHSRHRWLLFLALVLPSRRHQSMHPPLSRARPLPLSRWREASRRDAGMARRSASWKRKDGRAFPFHGQAPSFLRTGGGSSLGADLLLLLFAAPNISPRSPCHCTCCEETLHASLHCTAGPDRSSRKSLLPSHKSCTRFLRAAPWLVVHTCMIH